MHPSLVAVAGQQGGVFLRRQAVGAGHSDAEIRALTRPHGPWLVLRRGAYIERTTWEALDPYVGQPTARDWAAHLTMNLAHAMSHDSAGRAHRFSLLRTSRPLAHITRPGVGGSRTEHGVKHHLGQGLPWAKSFAGGLPVTPLARTAVDIAREHGLWAGVCAMDSALRAGATERDFARALVAMRHFPHIRRARLALDLGDAGADNAGESMARILVGESVPAAAIETQYPVLVDGHVVWLDLIVGCHAFEFDGKLKYLRSSEGGSRTVPPARSPGTRRNGSGWCAPRDSACRGSSGRTSGGSIESGPARGCAPRRRPPVSGSAPADRPTSTRSQPACATYAVAASTCLPRCSCYFRGG